MTDMTTPVSSEDVIDVLRGVMDPELGDNIVDLGMVRGAEIVGGRVDITIALTTAGCPLRATIKSDVECRVEVVLGPTSTGHGHQAVFGVVNFVTRAASHEVVRARVAGVGTHGPDRVGRPRDLLAHPPAPFPLAPLPLRAATALHR